MLKTTLSSLGLTSTPAEINPLTYEKVFLAFLFQGAADQDRDVCGCSAVSQKVIRWTHCAIGGEILKRSSRVHMVFSGINVHGANHSFLLWTVSASKQSTETMPAVNSSHQSHSLNLHE